MNEELVFAIRENDDIIIENNSFRDEIDALKLSKFILNKFYSQFKPTSFSIFQKKIFNFESDPIRCRMGQFFGW